MRPTAHSWNRRYEWAMSVLMVKMGLGILLAPLIGLDIVGVMVVLTDLGLSQAGVGVLFLGLGASGTIALYANGRFKHGACLRAACCGIRMIVWGQLTYGVLAVMIHQHSLYLVLFAWSTFMLFEGLQFSTTLKDWTEALRDRRQLGRLVGENATSRLR